MDDAPSSILTGSQRSVLAGEKSASHETKMRQRIRDRVYTAMRTDSVLVLNEISSEDRRSIFRGWEKDWKDKDLDPRPPGMLTRREELTRGVITDEVQTPEDAAVVEREYLKRGIVNLLAFLYLGIEEGNLGDFDEILEAAHERAAGKSHRKLEEFEYHATLSGGATLRPETIAELVRAGDRRITLREVKFAYEQGAISREEAEEFVGELDVTLEEDGDTDPLWRTQGDTDDE